MHTVNFPNLHEIWAVIIVFLLVVFDISILVMNCIEIDSVSFSSRGNVTLKTLSHPRQRPLLTQERA